jgi:hypothetical protein
MPITRTPLIDDDGSGTTGTVLNNAWQNGLYNAIDAIVPTTLRLGVAPAIANLTGDVTDYRPPSGELSPVWVFLPTVPANVVGILAEPDCTQHLLINASAQPLYFLNQNATAALGNRLITPGYAPNYLLSSWGSIAMIYLASNQSWLLQKAP